MDRIQIEEYSQEAEAFFEDLYYGNNEKSCDECNSNNLLYVRTVANGNIYKCNNCSKEIIS